MSTFNPGTNEPTGEQGSEPESWDEEHGISNEGQGEYDPAEVQKQDEQDEPAEANTDVEDADDVRFNTVANVQAYLDAAVDDEDRYRRADEVEQAENERDTVRVGVTNAIDKARQPTE